MSDLVSQILAFWVNIFSGLNSIPFGLDLASTNQNLLTWLGFSGGYIAVGDFVGYIFTVLTVVILVLLPVYIVYRLLRLTMGVMSLKGRR